MRRVTMCLLGGEVRVWRRREHLERCSLETRFLCGWAQSIPWFS